MPMEAEDLFFDLAFQYYLAGRAAYCMRLTTVVGNLLHHAIEMSCKGALSKWGWELAQLKQLNHRLLEIWEKLKLCSCDAGLNAYDDVVADLSDFEDLRYPDLILERGMGVSIELARSATVLTGKASLPRPEPKFKLYVQDVDRLFVAIYRAASRNLKALTVPEPARQYLDQDNSMAAEFR
jgi:hypothetical protein